MPRGYVGGKFILANAYYELKDVPVKGRVYRYWYFRVLSGARMRSIYCGKERPEISPLAAAAAFRAGEDLAARFREQKPRSRPQLPKPPDVTLRTIAVARRAGAAVYWQDGAHSRVMAIDRYARTADNLAAIAATIEAMRAIERHGGAVILERAFTGFTALPAPGPSTARGWREVLEIPADAVDVSVQLVTDRYRRLASLHHPDRPGGDTARFQELTAARDQALEALTAARPTAGRS